MPSFEWDEEKNALNEFKHGVSFEEAQNVFLDPNRLVVEDLEHSSQKESRFSCLGKIDRGICTVRFTYRNNIVRIYGAGFWRKGKKDMKKKTNNTQYTDEPILLGKRVKDFLPRPEELILKQPTKKITIILDSSSVDFFKKEATRLNSSYQRMMRNLLTEYANRMKNQDNPVSQK